MKRLIVLISMLLAFSVSCDVDDGKDKYLAPDEIGVEWQLSEDAEWYTLDVDIRRLNDSKKSDMVSLHAVVEIEDLLSQQIPIEMVATDGVATSTIIDPSEAGRPIFLTFEGQNSQLLIQINDNHPTSHVAIRFAKSGSYVLNLNRIEGSVRYGRTGDVFTGCGENYHTGDIDIPIDVHIAVP